MCECVCTYHIEARVGALALVQHACVGAVLALQRLLLALALRDEFAPGAAVQLGPVHQHGQQLVALLLYRDGLLVALDLGVQRAPFVSGLPAVS